MGYKSCEVEHQYPANVHILRHPTINSLLTKLCSPETLQPEFNRLVATIYSTLFIEAINNEWPRVRVQKPTRMTSMHPGCLYEGEVLDDQQKAVIVDIARAGMLPSQVGFDLLCHTVNPHLVRQDHIFASRMTNKENTVTHTDLSGSKIGGDVNQSIVFFPDPMGATGLSLTAVLDHYKKNVKGSAKKWIAVHLIITPEYIRQLHQQHPDVIIYTVRVDRGLSSSEILKTVPGSKWNQERGLNDQQYIVPGAGGVGELISNSFV
ncbi:uracil phosphoribosyltransferase [bacterium]|nr:uracil phosphoribosyltransferase [bacterium]